MASLDELISNRAEEFAAAVRQKADKAKNEEEIRIEVEKQLAFVQKEVGVELEGHHEFTVAKGRVDSVYQRVLIEYKNPNSAARLGARIDSPGTQKVVDQIKKRFDDFSRELKHPLTSLFGVGTDGRSFVFVRFREGKWSIQEPVDVNKHSVERFLWALFNLGLKGKPFSPEYLAADFGADSSAAQNGVRALYASICNATHPKAQTFFSQWKILFGEVCGYNVTNPSDRIKKLAQSYGIPTKALRPAELFFAVHTYYAIFMKLLASEIVAFFHKLPTPLQKILRSDTSAKLRREMDDLEAGSIFRHLNITNFLEGDLFAWYTSVWSASLEEMLRQMVAHLDAYNPGTLSEDPSGSRDLLKKLYQQLFPKSVRHDLGEYYTPDWLAESLLDDLRYSGDPDKRFLDPACGSGTFLVMAINRIRRWYENKRESQSFDEGELCRKILNNVVGFDLNPLAVMAARTNYLIAIRDLIGYVDRVELPVYLSDSIMTPSEYGDLFSGALGEAKEFKTAAARFLIPAEITTKRDDVARYADVLEECIRNGYSPAQFIERCSDEGLPVKSEVLHKELYQELVKLNKANKNGVWARIIKNAFAPLFVGRVDFVAGNPPWINWSNLPDDYRESTASIWQRYELFPHKGLRATTGSAMDDISVLMTYVSLDLYLKPRGKLGFVITQSVFKTEGGGEGFRNFRLPASGPIEVKHVADMSAFQPFEGAINRTATVVIQRDSETKYPVEYDVWKPTARITQDMDLAHVKSRMRIHKKIAQPVGEHKRTSPWIAGTPAQLTAVKKCFGPSDYVGRYGTHCHASGIYWVEVLRTLPNDQLLIRNLGDVGKDKYRSIEHRVDSGFVHRLARGRDVEKWRVMPRCSMILPQNEKDLSKALPDAVMKREFPQTYAYFKQFEDDLKERSGYKKFFRPGIDPFYSVYNVGPYTFANAQVVWREVAQDLSAAVVGADSAKDVIPDHTLVAVAVETVQEAHYLCALLNSALANFVVASYVALHPGPHILKYIRIPRFTEKDAAHKRLAALSAACHEAKSRGDEKKLSSLEAELDHEAARFWGVTPSELAEVQAFFADELFANESRKPQLTAA